MTKIAKRIKAWNVDANKLHGLDDAGDLRTHFGLIDGD